MKFSEAWLREWVNPDLARDDLLQQLTMAGLEVDGVDPVADTFTGVVVGLVESCKKHPDADKLSLCSVFDGEARHQVICGAPNVREGLRVAYAKVGAVLPDNFKIKKAKLRGVESFGMLCSAAELGLGDDHDGILELPATLSVGEDFFAAYALNDVSVDVDLTPNRGDCLSLRGLAREVGVLNNLAVAYPRVDAVAATHNETFPVELANPEGCPRYLGRVIKGIDLSKPTPAWMRERLRRCGLRSIDAAVDVTNYVLIELGQPMHAFDLKQISEGIVVRNAVPGDQLTLLDGQEVTPDEQTLLITDANGPVAIAGVMGGERSGVHADTEDLFLECAFFSPLAIAGTARRYGLHTDASHRYERGVDYELQAMAMERATQLLIDIVGGEPGPVTEVVATEKLPSAQPVTLRQRRLQQLLGTAIAAQQVDDAFARLDFQVIERSDQDGDLSWTIVPPSHRFDIAIEADLVEEICRIFGYNNIPSKSPNAALELRSVDIEQNSEAALKKHLAGLGLQEVITYTFVDPGLQDLLDPGVSPLALANPMSSEQSVMRTNMLPGLVDAARNNRARQQDQVRLFELGQTFVPGPQGLEQRMMIGGLLWGRRHAQNWHAGNDNVDFYDVKGLVDDLCRWAGLHDVQVARANDGILHPGQGALLYRADQPIGRFGRLHPEIEARLELSGAFVFELDAQKMLARPRRVFSGLSRYPSVRRDFAVVVDKTITAAEVEAVVREALGEILVEFRLFDVYEGKGIDLNEKSLAIGLTLQSQDATLNEEDIGHYAQAAVSALESAVKARLR
ncbi:MAG: phenylalanine--tRNA ligase subunit beta [bacterium]